MLSDFLIMFYLDCRGYFHSSRKLTRQLSMAWCVRQARSLYSLFMFALFGVLKSTSETTDRVQGLGSIDCPYSLTVHWNKILARPPYVENSTSDFDGLFPSNVFLIFHAFSITAIFIYLKLFGFFFLAYECLFKLLVWCDFQRLFVI